MWRHISYLLLNSQKKLLANNSPVETILYIPYIVSTKYYSLWALWCHFRAWWHHVFYPNLKNLNKRPMSLIAYLRKNRYDKIRFNCVLHFVCTNSTNLAPRSWSKLILNLLLFILSLYNVDNYKFRSSFSVKPLFYDWLKFWLKTEIASWSWGLYKSLNILKIPETVQSLVHHTALTPYVTSFLTHPVDIFPLQFSKHFHKWLL